MPAARAANPRRIISASDVLEAIHWRLSGLDPVALAKIEERIADLPELRDDDEAVKTLLLDIKRLFPRDRRCAWTLLLAVAALGADQDEKPEFFWGAGVLVVAARKKAAKPGGSRTGDPLSVLLREMLQRCPSVSPTEAWFDCVGIADDGGNDQIAGYDVETDQLIFFPRAGDTTRRERIDFPAFERRIRRIREAGFGHHVSRVRQAA